MLRAPEKHKSQPLPTKLQASNSNMSNSKFDAAAASNCYYTVLGLCKQASPVEIRSAYRKLALKWHPDRWMKNNSLLAVDANKRFQQIQEAYSVLSDNGKRLLYDSSGLIDFSVEDDEDIDDEGSSDFLQEMMEMIECTRHQKRHSLEELQVMLGEMMDGDDSIQFNIFGSSRKKTRFGTSS